MSSVPIHYGNTSQVIGIPDDWLAAIIQPAPVQPAAAPADLVRVALANPIGTQPISMTARPGQRAAVIVDDYTRKTPVRTILPQVLDELLKAGVTRQEMTIVVALGTHREMSQVELEAKIGPQIVRQYQVSNVSSSDRQAMVYLGTTPNGIPAWVNRTVAEADIRIGVGMITPHMDAGFSGGAKIILPGVCGHETVDAFHSASALIGENLLGQVESPARLALESFVADRVPLHFIVNAIITPGGELFQCVAGDCILAHRVGVGYSRQVFGSRISRRYPVVIANCHPYDVDWWQSTKGAFCADLVTAIGGTLILVTAAKEGNSTYPLVPGYVGRDIRQLKQDIQAGRIEDLNQAMAGVLFNWLKQRHRLFLVSDGITQADADTMGIPRFPSAEAALRRAVGLMPEEQRRESVAVIPMAGIVLPILAGD